MGYVGAWDLELPPNFLEVRLPKSAGSSEHEFLDGEISERYS